MDEAAFLERLRGIAEKYEPVAPPWTKEDEEQLRIGYPQFGPRVMAEALGRTPMAVATKAGRLDLRFTGRPAED